MDFEMESGELKQNNEEEELDWMEGDSWREKVEKLNYELKLAKDSLEREKILHEKEIRDLEGKVKEEGKKSDKLQTDQVFLFNKHKGLVEELDRVKSEMGKEVEASKKRERSSRSELGRLREELADREDELDEIKVSSRKRIDELDFKNHNLEKANKEINEELTKIRQELFKKQNTIIEQEQVVVELKNDLALRGRKRKRGNDDGDDDDSDGNGDSHGDNHAFYSDEDLTTNIFRRELTERSSQLRSLENQLETKNKYIDSLQSNKRLVDIVEQEKSELQTKIKTLIDVQRENTELQLRILDYEKYQSKWTSFLEKDDNFSSPEEIVRELMKIRIEKINLLSKIGDLEAKLTSNTSIESLTQDIQQLKDQLQDYKEKFNNENQQKIRQERQNDILSNEIKFLKDQLNAYENEDSILAHKPIDQEKESRINELEEIVSKLKKEISIINKDLSTKEGLVVELNSPLRKRQSNSDNTNSLINTNKNLQQNLDKSQQTITQLTREIQALNKQIEELSTSQTKKQRILELRDNPTSRHEAIKSDMLQALKKENEQLLSQLESKSSSGDYLVPKASLNRIQEEIKEYERKLKEQTKHTERLKEVFSKKSLEFREAVYSLLGYKVDLLPNRKVRATSVFTSSDSDFFTFLPDPKAKNKFIGIENSPLSNEFDNLITFWIKERQDIPCFLSALNLELYDRTTKAARF